MREKRAVDQRQAGRLSVSRAALAAAVATTSIYILCWLAAFAGVRELPHVYALMFTTADITSVYALLEGVVWSWVGGVLAGAVAALAYNFLADGS